MRVNEIKDGKDLMIDDLIIGCIETDIVGEATYKILCKVTNINHYGDVKCEALEPFPDELDWQEGDNFSWIEAIPITEKILEKNRMKIFEHRNPWQVANNLIKKWYSKDGSFYVSYYKVGDMFTYTLGTNLSRICNIKYIHELQHGLKLCKINKEIII